MDEDNTSERHDALTRFHGSVHIGRPDSDEHVHITEATLDEAGPSMRPALSEDEIVRRRGESVVRASKSDRKHDAGDLDSRGWYSAPQRGIGW